MRVATLQCILMTLITRGHSKLLNQAIISKSGHITQSTSQGLVHHPKPFSELCTASGDEQNRSKLFFPGSSNGVWWLVLTFTFNEHFKKLIKRWWEKEEPSNVQILINCDKKNSLKVKGDIARKCTENNSVYGHFKRITIYK